MRLSGETVAVVTGAGSGIGRSLALDLASRGASLALADVNAPALETTRDLARGAGQVTLHRVDVSSEDAVSTLAREVESAHGRVTLLVNNAGVALGGTFDEVSLEDLRWIVGVNFWGTVYGCEFFLPLLRREGAAHIVNVSSVFGLMAPPGQTGYAASKFAVRGFSEALRHELAGSNVGVSVVHPGGVRTGIARSARAGSRSGRDPARIAREVADFERTFVTSPGDAAARILRGVERGEPRILIGRDAQVIDLAVRLWPTRYLRVLERLT
ncbi:acetoin dehydrogenase (plasmid) [Deinococcus aetherius]|uniref:Acetoin dehydrogenase n=1 Tax=Deinococcus aetherius TaxID=200252 RepID=A0ABN6RPR6_9DEIO|nr:SDR family oxidoreductase [Deinococcus aetherius]BDP43859.1 acetoin dehydrogenase [Deinococcus aetherius]